MLKDYNCNRTWPHMQNIRCTGSLTERENCSHLHHHLVTISIELRNSQRRSTVTCTKKTTKKKLLNFGLHLNFLLFLSAFHCKFLISHSYLISYSRQEISCCCLFPISNNSSYFLFHTQHVLAGSIDMYVCSCTASIQDVSKEVQTVVNKNVTYLRIYVP